MVNDLILIIGLLILFFTGIWIVAKIMEGTIDFILGSIGFLLETMIIIYVLNSLGFTFCADLIEFVITIPSKFAEFVKSITIG